jgi:uracil-DNA glycosylase family 4
MRADNQVAHPDWHNAPVPSFGATSARLLVVGLAPGLRGANRTGRPFTGDYAGMLLYQTLIAFGYASGTYGESATDGLTLHDCRITNAVRCVPPQNLPTTAEQATCNMFLKDELAMMMNLRVILTLGLVSHAMVLRALGAKPSKLRFAHGGVHEVGPLRIVNSYHVSRYNTSTKRLTVQMFEDAVGKVKAVLF